MTGPGVTMVPPGESKPPLRRRVLRRLLYAGIAVSGLGVLSILAAGAVWLMLDQAVIRHRIEASLYKVSGHPAHIEGPLGLAFNPWPVLFVREVSLAQPEEPSGVALRHGWPDPWFLRAQDITAGIALWPLLHGHITVSSLSLARLDIRMTRNHAGEENWIIKGIKTPSASTAPPPVSAAGEAVAPHPKRAVPPVRVLRIGEASVVYHDLRNGSVWAAEKLRLHATEQQGTIALILSGLVQGVPVRALVEGGSVDAMLDPDEQHSWPLQINAQLLPTLHGRLDRNNPHLSVSGVVDHPRHGRGFHLMVVSRVLDGARLLPLRHAIPALDLPVGKNLPPSKIWSAIAALHDASLTFRLDDDATVQQGLSPVFSVVRLHVGDVLPGHWARLKRLDADWPGAEAALRFSAQGLYRNATLSLLGQVGQVQALSSSLLAGHGIEGESVPVRLSLHATSPEKPAIVGDLDFLGDVVAHPGWQGTSFSVTARVTDVSLLARLTRTALPEIGPVGFRGHVMAEAGAWRLEDASLTSAAGDISGAVTWSVPAHGAEGKAGVSGPVLGAKLHSARLDVDRLRQPFPAIPSIQPEGEPVRVDRPAILPSAPVPAPSVPSSVPSGVAPSRLSEPPSPFFPVWLKQGGGQIDWDVEMLHAGGMDWSKAMIGLSLGAEGIRVQPLHMNAPGQRGPVSAMLDWRRDGTLSATVDAAALPLEAMVALIKQPGMARGDIGIDAAVQAHMQQAGWLHNLNGHASVWSVGSVVSGAAIDPVLSRLVRQAGLPLHPRLGADAGIACFAARAEARDGIAVLRAFALETDPLRLSAAGYVDLRDQRLKLFLHPLLRSGGSGLLLPLILEGPFDRPSAKMRGSDAVAMRAAIQTSLTALGVPALAGAADAGAEIMNRADQGDCAPALAAARGQHAGPPAPIPSQDGKGKLSVQDLLKGLLR
ncbi:AsmA family protein [Granulibacter bethesdensis]|uniref:AsmA family protein n=1 Tax=Granulibacter bethesdensis TaxID=364410 RepID=UPI0009095962|nr:AsmA family protein [Granulibacter bethesdensis]APH56384.1 AsmA family protein [Granulibacter bethesdensis]